MCCGMHIVWAIYQIFFYQTSGNFRNEWKDVKINQTDYKHALSMAGALAFNNFPALSCSVLAWYLGAILFIFLTARFLLPSVQKKNIYVSFSDIVTQSNNGRTVIANDFLLCFLLDFSLFSLSTLRSC